MFLQIPVVFYLLYVIIFCFHYTQGNITFTHRYARYPQEMKPKLSLFCGTWSLQQKETTCIMGCDFKFN